MDSLKKILFVISFFFLLTNFLQAQTGNIKVNLRNINGNSTPYPGANGKVFLYDSNYNTITFKNTDSLGTTTFTNQPYGTYYLEGYHNANPPTIFGSEYWGSKSVNHDSSTTNLNLIRYLPYYSDYKVFINSSNEEVTGLTVASGTQLRIEVTFNNPNSSKRTIKGRIVIDRNRTSTYDFDQTSLSDSISGNSNRKFIFSFTPTEAGSYYGAAGTLTSINSNYLITDGTGWFTNPMFTINETKITTIDFAGLKWDVSYGHSGPGPNNWFNGINSVWTDNSGSLHLAIRKIDDKWYCSGIYAQDTMGYGEYSFSVSSNVELYDPNIIVGLFVYENDFKEIDIEFSRWGDTTSNASWYVVQSQTGPSSTSFSLNLQNTSSTHKFTWTAQSIKFQSYKASGDSIKEWTYQGSKNPVPNQMKPHINFWLFKGLPTSDQNNAELVISNFKYTPIHLLTDVSKNEVVPTDFKLFQNYPNPFNPETVISYTIPNVETRHGESLQHVKLRVYDVLGRDVATLVNEYQQPGKYEKTFHGTSLQSGIYFYRLQTGEFTQSKKMILLK